MEGERVLGSRIAGHEAIPYSRYAACMAALRLCKCFDLAELPSDWQLVRLTLDWAGHPLLLFVEGKPPQPEFRADPYAWSRWYRTPPKAHHLVFWHAGKLQSVTFDHAQGLSVFHVQPFEGGWLLGERRGGRATLCDAQGAARSVLDLGDASEDLQTTPDGRIWVSYFDEGVFGSGISRQGLVCFDAAGRAVFRYAEFAERHALPMICDCYAMNVDETGAVWLNYYMDFPLVQLRAFTVERVWREFGTLGNTFAVREDELISMRGGQLEVHSLGAAVPYQSSLTDMRDEQGHVLAPNMQRYTEIAGRGAHLVLNTGQAVYKLCS